MEKSHSLDRETAKLFWRATMRDKRGFAMALLFPLGALMQTVAVPFFIGRIIAGLGNPAVDPTSYIPELLIVAVLGIAANRIGAPALFRLQAEVMGYLQAQAFDALMRRSMGFHNNNVGGKLVSDAIDHPQAFSQLLDSLFTNLLPFVLILLVGSALVIVESWQLGLVVFVMVAYALTSAWHFTRSRAGLRRRRLVASKSVTGHLADTIVNVPTVKMFANEKQELNNHQQLNDHLTDIRVEDWTSAARIGNTRITILLTMELAFVFALVYLTRRDPSILGIGIFAFSFITMMSTRLFQINIMLRQVEDGFLNASPMTEILLQEPEIKDLSHAPELQVEQGGIELSNVAFRYEDADKGHVFQELSLDIRPGEKVGLVGPSGGGKSTLTRLLLRFEDINSGTIRIDGQNIAEVSQSSLREAISYVPQEPLLFHRTIRENIAYSNPEASDEQVVAAALQAHADLFITQLPRGYDTIVGERGVKLSGGQRQRIAIARAILKDAPILIFDEATSALDSESEALIQEALWKLMEKRTAIVIAHRLSTIQKLDRIIVLEDGAITEQGSHKQLLKQHGTYAKLWNRQSGGFIED
jgi:ATP-binding cassette subfamily B protein